MTAETPDRFLVELPDVTVLEEAMRAVTGGVDAVERIASVFNVFDLHDTACEQLVRRDINTPYEKFPGLDGRINATEAWAFSMFVADLRLYAGAIEDYADKIECGVTKAWSEFTPGYYTDTRNDGKEEAA